MPIDPAALALIRSTPATLRAMLAGLPEEVLLAPNPEGLAELLSELEQQRSGFYDV
jgi:hypothetical protein